MHYKYFTSSLLGAAPQAQHWSQAVLDYQPARAPATPTPSERLGLFDFEDDEGEEVSITDAAETPRYHFLVVPGLAVPHPPQTTRTDADGTIHKSCKYPTPKPPSPIITLYIPSSALPNNKRALSSPEEDARGAKHFRAEGSSKDSDDSIFDSDDEEDTDDDEERFTGDLLYPHQPRWGAVDWHEFDDIVASSTGATERHQPDQLLGLGLPGIPTPQTFHLATQNRADAQEDALDYQSRDIQVNVGSDAEDEEMGAAKFDLHFTDFAYSPTCDSINQRKPRVLPSSPDVPSDVESDVYSPVPAMNSYQISDIHIHFFQDSPDAPPFYDELASSSRRPESLAMFRETGMSSQGVF